MLSTHQRNREFTEWDITNLSVPLAEAQILDPLNPAFPILHYGHARPVITVLDLDYDLKRSAKPIQAREESCKS